MATLRFEHGGGDLWFNTQLLGHGGTHWVTEITAHHIKEWTEWEPFDLYETNCHPVRILIILS